MKVLLYRYGSICEPDLILGLKSLGLEVLEYTREMTKKDYGPAECVRELSEYLQDKPVDFVMSINFFPTVSMVCQIFKLRYLTWIVDAPVMELYTSAITNEVNRVFVFDRALYNDIYPLNPTGVFHLPLAANVASKKKLFSESSEKTKQKYTHDIAFVGSLYTEKCPYDRAKDLPASTRGYFDAIMRAQERVYGFYFIEELLEDKHIEDFKNHINGFYTLPGDNYLTDRRTLSQLYIGNKITAMERVDTFKELSKRFEIDIYTASDTSGIPGLRNRGLAKTLTEMPIIFNRAGININMTSKPIRTGLPLRIFDILSCEGFLISNYQEEISELFVPGEEIVMYGSVEELSDLCAYYLEHKKESREIARCGYEKLAANYTYEKQLERMFEMAFGDIV